MKNRYPVYIGLLFILVFLIRLYFAFQTPYFSEDEAYFTLRQVENIKETGLPIFDDELSFGGRSYRFLPLFDYIVAFFAIFIPASIALKIISNLFAASIIIPVFLITDYMTKNKSVALIGALIASFVPIYFYETINSASIYTLSIPLMLTLMYLFMKINTTKKPNLFIILFIALLLTGTSALFLIFSILLYLLFAWTEGLNVKREEIELSLFSLFLSLFFYVFFFRDALMLHGPRIIYANLPKSILDNYFLSIDLAQAIINIGIIPAISAIFVSFLYFSKRKKKTVYLPLSSCFVITIMLIFKLIPVILGLTFLGIMCAVLFGEFYSYIINYFEKTKFSALKWGVYIFLLIIVLLTSVIPSYRSAKQITLTQNEEMIMVSTMLNKITKEDATIAAAPGHGHLITYFAKRKNVIDSNYLYIEDVEQRYDDLRLIYTSAVSSKALEIMEEYSIDYIIFDTLAKETYNTTRISYADNKCFPKVLRYNNAEVYEKKCSLV